MLAESECVKKCCVLLTLGVEEALPDVGGADDEIYQVSTAFFI